MSDREIELEEVRAQLADCQAELNEFHNVGPSRLESMQAEAIVEKDLQLESLSVTEGSLNVEMGKANRQIGHLEQALEQSMAAADKARAEAEEHKAGRIELEQESKKRILVLERHLAKKNDEVWVPYGLVLLPSVIAAVLPLFCRCCCTVLYCAVSTTTLRARVLEAVSAGGCKCWRL